MDIVTDADLLLPDTFTIRAVAQDDFEDVAIPNAPVKPGQAPHMSTVTSAGPAPAK